MALFIWGFLSCFVMFVLIIGYYGVAIVNSIHGMEKAVIISKLTKDIVMAKEVLSILLPRLVISDNNGNVLLTIKQPDGTVDRKIVAYQNEDNEFVVISIIN